MNYKVLKTFKDKETLEKYLVDSEYETDSEKRAVELQKQGFIGEEVVEETQRMKHLGGGYYELPNGEKVKGKEAALNRLNELGEGNES